MNNWFKRLFGLDHEEDEHRPNEISDQEEKRPQQSNLYKSPNKEARVVYDYPKGHFRFPLIPDENNQAKAESNINTDNFTRRVEEHRPVQTRVAPQYVSGISRKEFRNQSKERNQMRDWSQRRGQSTKQTSASTSSYKSPFKPSEVPSPIYGFNRPEPEPEPIIHHEEVSATVEIFEESLEGIEEAIVVEAAPTVKEYIDETLIEDEPEDGTIDQHLNQEEFRSTIIQEDIDEDIDDEPHIPEPMVVKEEEVVQDIQQQEEIATDAISETIETGISYESVSEIVDEPVDEIVYETVHGANEDNAAKETKEESRKRRGVPFNVMMLKQDRESIKKAPPVHESQQTKEGHLNKPPLSLLDVPL